MLQPFVLNAQEKLAAAEEQPSPHPAEHSSTTVDVGDAHVQFMEGDKVEAEFEDEGWVLGAVVAARADGTVDVVFDADGHTESYDAESARAELRAAVVVPTSPVKREKPIDFTTAYNELFKERCLYSGDMSAPPQITPADIKVRLSIPSSNSPRRLEPAMRS